MKLKIVMFLSLLFTSFFAYATVMPKQQPNAADSESVSWLIVLNQNEIDAGKVARTKATNPKVKDYAKKMIAEHSANLAETKKLLKGNGVKMVNTDNVKSLKKQGKDDLAKLKKEDKKSFDSTYMNAMVSGHDDALSNLDKMIPQIQNDKIKMHFETTRDKVNQHLNDGKEIVKDLNS